MDSTFRWMSRLTNYCVTVVEQSDPAQVLAALGADPDTAVTGDIRDQIGLYSLATGYRPVVRVVKHGQWCVVIENFSFEGVREPALQRLSATGRVVSVSLGHNAQYTMGFAEHGGVTGPFPVPTRQDPEWHQLNAAANRVGVSLADWLDHNRMRSAVELAGKVSGVPLDDSVMSAPGVLAVILPLLPVSFAESGPVRSEIDAQIVALTESGTSEQLAPAVAEQVQVMLVNAGVTSNDLLTVLAEPPGSVADDSPAGQALRRVIAEQSLIVGSPMGRPSKHVDVEAVGQRVSAGLTAAALLLSGPKAAVAEMLHCRPGPEWRAQLAAAWESIVATPAATERAAARLATHMARRARSAPVPMDLLAGREQADERARAVPFGERRPAPVDTHGADES